MISHTPFFDDDNFNSESTVTLKDLDSHLLILIEYIHFKLEASYDWDKFAS